MSLPKHGLVLVALAAFCNPGALVAQSTTTAFFVSQRTTGNTIQCTYDGLEVDIPVRSSLTRSAHFPFR